MTPEEIHLANEELLRAYKLAFGSPAGKEVLIDLAPFCRAAESCFHIEPREHARAEGRREVWLRINSFLNLTYGEVLAMRASRQPPRSIGEDDAG